MLFNKDNCFCISLLNNKERCDNMKRRCNEIGLEYTVFEAYTKNNLKEKFVNYLNESARGCSQSHFYLWKHIIEKNIPYTLILEDDACFDKLFFSKLSLFEKEIKDPEVDCIFLNSCSSINPLYKWVPITEQYLTGGYILYKNGAEKLVSMYKNCLYSADWMTTRLQKFNHSYGFFPWLIIQEGNESTIGSNIDLDHKKVLRLLGEINYSIDNYII
jgi:GR25 family glycosyltransferase involved in LPS biosynthesis